MTDDELSAAKKIHDENVARAQEAAKRDQERQRARQEAQAKREQQQHERQRASHAANMALEAARQSSPAPQPRSNPHTTRPSKRPVDTVGTVSDSRTLSPCTKKPTHTAREFVMVWSQDGAFGPHQRESLVDRALREGPRVPSAVDMGMVTSSLRDGICITSTDEGKTFGMSAMDPDPWYKSIKWKEFIAPIEVKDDGVTCKLVTSGGTCCRRIGCGTFNFVVSFPAFALPSWMPTESVHRFTRPDKGENGKDSKYQNEYTTKNEMRNAIFASSNGIGVPVYNIACFSAPREGRTLRYGLVMSLERAECDMLRGMDNMDSERDGMDIADKCIDLLYNVSRCGVAFFDIKPANILVFKRGDGETSLCITDYDPAFFLHLPDEDWRVLLLLNLSLLSTHIHNADFGAVGRGYAKAVAPTMRQLIRRRGDYNGDWLFATRCVKVKFEEPKSHSHFELQKLFAAICTSYFFNHKRAGPAKDYAWKNTDDNQRNLNAHWETPLNRYRWPDRWLRDDEEPLVKQLVDFSLKYA
jgi:hypothetical protein